MFGGNKMTAEEKKKLKAAIRLQCAYRCYLARRRAQDHYRSHFKKVYDINLRKYVYQNKDTQDVFEDLPEYFNEQQIPIPRDFAAPPDYNPGNEATGEGYALIISNSQFPLGKWAPSHSELDHDYEKIFHTVTHDFIGRIRPENCVGLKNPTTMEVKDAIKHLSKICRVNGFIFIYIATHIINIIGAADPENDKETAYLAFRNSIWGKTKEITESCIGIIEFTGLINGIKAKNKTIVLNYAHAPPPRKALFTSSKQVYPPTNILFRMADLCRCPVIGSCTVGFAIKDYLKGYPPLNWSDPSFAQLSRSESSKSKKQQRVAAEQQVQSNSSSKSNPRWGLQNAYGLFYSALWDEVMRDFNLPVDKPISKTPRPAPPGPVWTQNEQTGFAIKVDLPNDNEVRACLSQTVIILQ